MKLICSFDPESNPTDAARACIQTLNSDITKLHNIVLKWSNILKEHPDDNSLMSKIVDDSSYIQSGIDNILNHYS